jgi:FkbM family methyltransferase
MNQSQISNFERPIEMRELRSLLMREDPTILELGAHNGWNTMQFLESFSSSFVHCFECDPRPLKNLKKVLKKRKVKKRVFVYEIAVSDKCGEHVFFQSGGHPSTDFKAEWDCSSSLLEPTGHLEHFPWCNFNRRIYVNTISLDSWYVENKKRLPELVDLIWADLQGAEHLMIKGGKTVLDRTRYLFCEYYNTPMYAGQRNMQELFDMLGSNWQPLATYEGYNFLAVNTILKKL